MQKIKSCVEFSNSFETALCSEGTLLCANQLFISYLLFLFRLLALAAVFIPSFLTDP